MPSASPARSLDGRSVDVAVIGAGFGGLGAAVELARGGADVVLCEALAYPGGCASTFRRRGYAFEAGATLFSGFGRDQLFGRWIHELALPVTVDRLDPVVELRASSLRLSVTLDRAAFVASLCALPGAPAAGIRAFFDEQRRVADLLWTLFDDPTLLPPFDAAAIGRHALRSPRYLALLPLLGQSLGGVLARHRIDGFAPLRVYLDALCQITVQCSASEAEAPFAFGAMDYYWRGTGHVRGGIGELASALAGAVQRLGGTVSLANAVKSITREREGYVVTTRRGRLRARAVVANLLPQGVRRLLSDGGDGGHVVGQVALRGARRALDRLGDRVAEGWGAAMLYMVVEPPPGAGDGAHHLDLVLDEAAPFVEGNHVFVSVSGARDVGRAPEGRRTITASTHVPMKTLLAKDPRAQGAYVAEVQARMRATIAARAPEWTLRVDHAETASPRTFERFTGRFAGYVGGIPRRAGLGNYRTLGPMSPLPGLYLVGDSVFPGQSTLATAIGGVRVAARLARELGVRAAA